MLESVEASVLSDERAERAILAAFMNFPESYFDCALLRTEDFYLDSNRQIFRAIAQLNADGTTVNLVTLSNELSAAKLLSSIGGVSYLSMLDREVVPQRHAVIDYMRLIKEAAKRRRIHKLSSQIMSDSMDGSETPDSISARWEESMMQIIDDRDDDNSHVSATLVKTLDLIERERNREPGMLGLSYGVPALDEVTSGMHPGEITVLGGRSSVGKSSLMIQAAIANCRAGIGAHLFSLEMTRDQVYRRILSVISGVPFYRFRDPRHMSDHDAHRKNLAAEQLAQWPLRVDERSDIDVSQITSLARLSIRRHGTRFVGVDYAQIVNGPGKDERTRVAGVSRSLTSMVKHENCSLMLLSQLRKVKQEEYDKAPHISDLRETGQLENDAHVVLLAHRGWDSELGRIASDGQILIPKQRSGETGTVNVTFDRNFVVFK
jgi:replicative DNA helicase